MTLPSRHRRTGHPGTPSRRALLAGLAGALATGGCTGGTRERRRIRIATGSSTAVYYAIGSALKGLIERELPDVDVTVLVTAASLENVEMIADGRADVGFTQADVVADGGGAVPGTAALARVYDDLLHLVVRADGPVRALADLRGRRVAVGARGSGTLVTAGRLLSVAGMSTDGTLDQRQWGLDDALAALSRSEIDAFFFSGGLPVTGIQRLGAGTPIRLVDLADWAAPLRRAYGQVYTVRDVPASAYGTEAAATVAVPDYLIVPESMPEETAYDLTRLLMERRATLALAHPAAERLDIRSAIATLPVPLHPGAGRYYRSVKP
ncbi:TAXI family TRAP transporter solute-binding subunit [Actinoplanes sp. NPDC051851]|uniref:TAXI family TRAP transporter solute-binding subunit n=1 Tax=Actinoplanes sp. NPDC051851 TaxID=3154753 RepID=UPI00344379FA